VYVAADGIGTLLPPGVAVTVLAVTEHGRPDVRPALVNAAGSAHRRAPSETRLRKFMHSETVLRLL
jgi:hypothetical protein